MKIGFDAKRAFFNHSGLGNYSRNLIYGLSEYFPENELFLYSPKAPNKDNQLTGSNIYIRTPEGILDKSLSSIWRSMKLGKVLAEDRLDIYHGLSNELPADIKQSNAKSVVTIHDLIFLKHPEWYNAADVAIYKRKFKFACENADLIIATSKQTKLDITEYYKVSKNKIRVVYQSCDSRFYAISQDDKTNPYSLPKDYILYVGALAERKNVNNIIKALSAYDDKTLVLVGNGKPGYAKQLHALIQSLNLENRVHILNNVPDKHLPDLYRNAALFVYPSFYEGFGIPVLEAFCCETPVITSEGTTMAEFSDDAALLINPESVGELAEAIAKALTNNTLRTELTKKGSAIANKLSPKNFATQVMQAYQSIL